MGRPEGQPFKARLVSEEINLAEHGIQKQYYI